MIRRKFLFLAALTGLAIAGLAPLARADLQISVTSGGETVFQQIPLDTGPTVIAAYSFSSGIDITTATGTSNSPGTDLFAVNTAGIGNTQTLGVVNTDDNFQTVTITVSSQNFTAPNSPPPLTVTDTVSGTVIFGSVSGTAQGFADVSNTLVGTSSGTNLGLIPGTGSPVPASAFAVTPVLSFSAGTGTSFSTSQSTGGFSPDGSKYSLTFTETLTLAPGAIVQLTGGNVQVLGPSPVVPAPAGLVLALTGLPLLGLGHWLRRRKTPVKLA